MMKRSVSWEEDIKTTPLVAEEDTERDLEQGLPKEAKEELTLSNRAKFRLPALLENLIEPDLAVSPLSSSLWNLLT
jgi:hypothetical protein